MSANWVYSNSRNSSTVNPDCFKMSERVPLASEPCMGTTVRNTVSPTRLSSETWLPFCLNSTNPAFLRARTTRSPETVGSLVISLRDFDDRPEGSFAVRRRFWGTPSFEIQLNGLAQVGPSRLDIFPLRRDAKLRAARDVPFIFFGDQRGEAVVHTRNRIRLRAQGQGSRRLRLREFADSAQASFFRHKKLFRGKNG